MITSRHRYSPLAYHIALTCYGHRLHGSESGSVDCLHNIPGTPFIYPDPSLERAESLRMDQPPYFLDACRRKIVMAAVMQTCSYRGWSLLAAHIRTTHVHVCIVAPEPPEKVMNDLNSYASRALNRAGLDRSDRKRWARHGSTRYKWTTDEVEAAVDYIVRGQGVPLEVFEKS